MTLLCEECDRSIIENESEYYNYLATLRKKDDKSFYKKHTINKFNLDEINKILNDYISTHNKNFDFYFFNCEFVIELDNNFIANIKSSYFCNTDITNINKFLLYDIDCFKSMGYKFYIVNQMTINLISDRCNLTYEKYINQPMSMCERKINIIIARNPEKIKSLDRSKNHPLIIKYSHIPFINQHMYITNAFDYDILTLCNCTNNDNDNNDKNIEIKIPLFTKILCGLSLICLISFMVYTFIKPLFNNKLMWRNTYTQIIHLAVS